jgi:hypothetical protein
MLGPVANWATGSTAWISRCLAASCSPWRGSTVVVVKQGSTVELLLHGLAKLLLCRQEARQMSKSCGAAGGWRGPCVG